MCSLLVNFTHLGSGSGKVLTSLENWPWETLVVNKCIEDRGQQTLRSLVLGQTWS